MLTSCTPGWTVELTDHYRVIKWSGRTHPSFPKHDEVQVGHIRQLVRKLEIDRKCARRHLEILGG